MTTLRASMGQPLELKGHLLSLTRLRLSSPDLGAIRTQLQQLTEQMPEAAQGLPVVIDAPFALDLASVWTLLRERGMQPIGVCEGPLAEAGRALGLVVLPDEGSPKPRRTTKTEAPAPAEAPKPAPRKPTRIVDTPVRSGQQIYAEGGDLIVTGAVSAGAEIIADGCVHAYGPMRGRAIAGARGDEAARVFCRKFEAELVAVGGVYAVADQMQGLRGFTVQAFLRQGKLKLELMNA